MIEQAGEDEQAYLGGQCPDQQSLAYVENAEP